LYSPELTLKPDVIIEGGLRYLALLAARSARVTFVDPSARLNVQIGNFLVEADDVMTKIDKAGTVSWAKLKDAKVNRRFRFSF